MRTSSIALLGLSVLAACGGRSAKTSTPLPGRSVSPEAAAELYRTLCSSCHGDDGSGDTPLARDLDPAPRNMGRCNFKLQSTPAGSLPTDGDLYRTLAVGLPGTAMPGLAGLVGPAELAALVGEVKRRAPCFATEKAEPALAGAGAEPYSQESAERGGRIYAQQGCPKCHGAGGRGDGPAAGSLKDAEGRPIRPANHAAGVFRSGFRRADIYRAFSTGLNGTPMPAVPDTLTSEERWDLANHIVWLSQRRCRVGRYLTQPASWYEPAAAWPVQRR